MHSGCRSCSTCSKTSTTRRPCTTTRCWSEITPDAAWRPHAAPSQSSGGSRGARACAGRPSRPRSPPPGGNASGAAEPDPRRSLGLVMSSATDDRIERLLEEANALKREALAAQQESLALQKEAL